MTFFIKVISKEAHNRITKAQTTVLQKPDKTSYPENGPLSFSGVLFGSFLHYLSRLWREAKKNDKQ
jgi:hypothetical protein